MFDKSLCHLGNVHQTVLMHPDIDKRAEILKMRDLGVDYISSGALTHSAPIMDISLKNLHATE